MSLSLLALLKHGVSLDLRNSGVYVASSRIYRGKAKLLNIADKGLPLLPDPGQLFVHYPCHCLKWPFSSLPGEFLLFSA